MQDFHTLFGNRVLTLLISNLVACPQSYQHRWVTYNSIFDVADNVADIIYGSHSPEHVHDIEKCAAANESGNQA